MHTHMRTHDHRHANYEMVSAICLAVKGKADGQYMKEAY